MTRSSARPALDLGRRTLPWRGQPRLMGVVNVTPDSFSDGGRYLGVEAAVNHALALVEAGADLLDVGGESSRPGAEPVDLEEERRRVLPVIETLRVRVDVPISVDTTKAAVARDALRAGAEIVNDISGLRFDPAMLEVVSEVPCGVVLMHMQGEPRTMQADPHYDDVVREVRDWFAGRLEALRAGGVGLERILLDPGIGFGKRLEHNLTLLRHLDALRLDGLPLLLGASRKRFLGALLDEPRPEARLEGDLAVAAHAFLQRVEVLRVHDVRAVHRFLQVCAALWTDGAPGVA